MVDQVWQTRLASGDPLEALLHTAQVRIFTILPICHIVAGSLECSTLLQSPPPYVPPQDMKIAFLLDFDKQRWRYAAYAGRRGSGQMGGGQGHQAQRHKVCHACECFDTHMSAGKMVLLGHFMQQQQYLISCMRSAFWLAHSCETPAAEHRLT